MKKTKNQGGATPAISTNPKFKRLIKAKTRTDKYGNIIKYYEVIEIDPKDFGWLKKLPYNREVLPAMVEKLGTSIINFGMLRTIILIQFKYGYYVCDGQHILASCIKSEIPVHAYIVPVADTEEHKIMQLIIAMNNTARQWSLSQYAKNWAKFLSLNNSNNGGAYDRLNLLKTQFNVTYSMLGELMFKGTQSEAKKAIKNGTFAEKSDPTRIDRLLSAMENFHHHTGISIKHTHTASGLARFIFDTGLDTYLKKEKEFIKAVQNAQKIASIPSFARTCDSQNKWGEIWATI